MKWIELTKEKSDNIERYEKGMVVGNNVILHIETKFSTVQGISITSTTTVIPDVTIVLNSGKYNIIPKEEI